MLNREQIEYLLPYAFNAAVKAGARILDIYTNGERIVVDLKSDLTPIILADREAHTIIKQHLGLSHIPVLSEEGRDILFEERQNWDLFWMVDPLDGTKEFIKGNGEFTVNIALMSDNKPVIGIIYVPYVEKLYYAIKGSGSYVISVEPSIDSQYTLEQILKDTMQLPLSYQVNDPVRIAVSRSHNTTETFEKVEQIKHVHPNAIVIEQGSSYKFCLLAQGDVDIYNRTSDTYEWDTAAGDLILSESGGDTLSTPSMTPLYYNKASLLNPHFCCKSKYFK